MTTSDEAATFCYDHYQHPLLWCEEKKRLVERRNAEESLRMWRRRKAEEIARKDKEKQEYYELFVKHCPWGRPGGGAPNVDVRRKDITAIGLHSTPSIGVAHRLSSLQPCRFSDYFSQRKKCHDHPLGAYNHQHHQHQHQPHRLHHQHKHHHLSHHHHEPHVGVHHAPDPAAGSVTTICERNLAGPATDGKNGEESLQITLKDHPSMSFRNKGHVDIEVRYKPTAPGKGKPMLEKIVVTENDKCPAPARGSPKKKRSGPAKPEKPASKDPWGKAGPGGKPWRSPKAVGSSFMKSLGWTNKEMLKELDQDNPVTPAEKHTFRKPRPTKKLDRCCDMCTCTCPAMTASAMKPLPKKPPAGQGSKEPAPGPATTSYEQSKSKLCPRFVRHCGRDANPATTTPDHSAATTVAGGGGGGVELVPLLARRRAKNRPISLSSTDITKRTPSNDRLSTAVDLRYLHDLNTQISQKRRSISVTRQLEKDLCSKHFETFDTFWGRPGHGAPSEIKTKLKLDNLLYGVQTCSE